MICNSAYGSGSTADNPSTAPEASWVMLSVNRGLSLGQLGYCTTVQGQCHNNTWFTASCCSCCGAGGRPQWEGTDSEKYFFKLLSHHLTWLQRKTFCWLSRYFYDWNKRSHFIINRLLPIDIIDKPVMRAMNYWVFLSKIAMNYI